VIAVSQLTKAYGNVLAVDHIDFEVAKGQIVGFLGPNGAGKSTTLRMLTCYMAPTGGGATINGFDIFHQSEQVRQNLGYLPENTPLYTEMKVEEYLHFRGRLRGMDRKLRNERIEYVVRKCWLGDFRKRIIGHLSKGMRQRVGLADALLHNPAVLILDEPTVGLDPSQVIESRSLLKELAGQHTILLSTHILREVEATCDRAIFIRQGRIVAQGTLDELRASRRMQSRVLVECRGPAEQVKNVLSRVSGVGKVEMLNGEHEPSDGFITAAIRPQESRDVREEVARTVVQNGWPLREVRLERGTLEEFFVELMATQAMGRPAQGGTGGAS
jgi:ABC-2 type transport system ATP-binding protein